MSTPASNAATKPIEEAVYAKERLQQEGNAASAQTQGVTQPYVAQAKDTLNSAAGTAAAYATAAKDSVVNATQTGVTGTGNPSTTGQTGPTYVDQAKELAAATAATAQNVAAGAAATAGTYVNAAQEKLSSASTQTGNAANDFQKEAAAHTNAAAREGEHDVNNAKATTGSYVDTAKNLAGTALSGAQTYVNAGKQQLDNFAATHPPNPETTLGSITAQLHSVTSAALGTTGQYLASAHSSLQPQGDAVKHDLEAAAGTAQEKVNVATGYGIAAKEQAQPHVDDATAAAKHHLSNAQTTISSQPVSAAQDPLAPAAPPKDPLAPAPASGNTTIV